MVLRALRSSLLLAVAAVTVSVRAQEAPARETPSVHFAVDSAPVAQVLDAVAAISGTNIIVSPKVQGNVTLRVEGVPWRDALTAIVKQVGAHVVEEGRIVRIATTAELTKIGVQTYELSHGHDVEALLESVRDLLTPGGKMQFFTDRSVVVVRDEFHVLVDAADRIRQWESVLRLETELAALRDKLRSMRDHAFLDATALGRLQQLANELQAQVSRMQAAQRARK